MTTPDTEPADLETPELTPADDTSRERDKALLRAVPDLHKPRPLSTFLWGTQEVWFVGGGRAERRICQHNAATFKRLWAGQEASEPVEWHTGRWASFESQRVAMVEWTRDCTYGADYSTEDKVVLRDKGYDRGHLGALVDLWKDVREPSYSPLVAEWLLRIVATEESSSHDTFTVLARLYEGGEGAERARLVWDTAGRGEAAVLLAPGEDTASSSDDLDQREDDLDEREDAEREAEVGIEGDDADSEPGTDDGEAVHRGSGDE